MKDEIIKKQDQLINELQKDAAKFLLDHSCGDLILNLIHANGKENWVYASDIMAKFAYFIHKKELAELKQKDEPKPSDEDIINYALYYISHKDLKPANKGLIKDALIIGAKAMRDNKISISPK